MRATAHFDAALELAVAQSEVENVVQISTVEIHRSLLRARRRLALGREKLAGAEVEQGWVLAGSACAEVVTQQVFRIGEWGEEVELGDGVGEDQGIRVGGR